jgi:hypothetical protein
MPERAPHRHRKAAPQKTAERLLNADPRSIDDEEGPQHQVFQIEHQIAVERDGPRDGERRRCGAVQQGQLLQLVGRKVCDATALDARDQIFQRPPGALAALAKLGAAQHDFRRGRGDLG